LLHLLDVATGVKVSPMAAPRLSLVGPVAFALTRIDSAIAGRAFAAYGGIYILSSLIWMATVERTKPDLWDIIGTLLCLLGSAFILLPHRA
jgi:small multidrug resistance family-3 protein